MADLVLQLVLALIQLLVSETPLVLYVNVDVELPRLSLSELGDKKKKDESDINETNLTRNVKDLYKFMEQTKQQEERCWQGYPKPLM